MWAVMSILSFTSLSVRAFDVRSNQPICTETQGDCDSLFITGVEGFAVKNVTVTKKIVSFVVCGSKGNKVKKVPWTQIQYIKKADGRIITAKNTQDNTSPEEKEELLERKIKNLLVICAISFFFGLSIIVGVFVLIKSTKYREKIKGHPKEKKLRKQLNVAEGLSFVLILKFILSFILSVILLGYLIKNALNNLFNWEVSDPQ